jgi:hypothetical protein
MRDEGEARVFNVGLRDNVRVDLDQNRVPDAVFCPVIGGKVCKRPVRHPPFDCVCRQRRTD